MLDNTDRQILSILSSNGRITMKELGDLIHLTGQATASRVQKLEDKGIIEGYTININKAKTGLPIHALLNLYIMNTTQHQPCLDFLNKKTESIKHIYKISGDCCYILECYFPSNEFMDDFLNDLNRHANYRLSLIIKDVLQ